MRIKSNLSSAEEQACSAEGRRSAKPEHGKSKWLTSAVGGALALGAMAFCGSPAFAHPVTPPGETAGLDTAVPLPEGAYFINIVGSGGDYLIDDKKSNLTFDVPVLAWATPWQIHFFGLTGRFEVIAATPVIGNVGIPYCDACGVNPLTGAVNSAGKGIQGVAPPLGGRDYTAMYNPFAEAGFAWDLGNGWAFSSFDGGYGPVDNELRLFGQDVWVYNNRSALGWIGDLGWGMKDDKIKGTFAIESILGYTGYDQQTGQKTLADYWNLNLTGFVTMGKWDVGVVGFYSTDIENFGYGSAQCGGPVGNTTLKCEQARAAVGPMIEYDFPGISVQVNYTIDVYDENYRNINGSTMQINQFWLKTVIPLWTAPKLEESMK